MKNRTIGIIAVIFMVLLSACSSRNSIPDPIEVTIEMSEYAFSPADLQFEVGQEVTINLVNIGVLDHEIMFGRSVMLVDNRPSGYQTDLFEEANVEPVVMMMDGEMSEDHEEDMDMDDDHEEGEDGDDHDEDTAMDDGHMEHSGFMVVIPPSESVHTIQFTVTEEMVGEWEIGCFELLGVHYDSGMFGTLTITN